MSTGRVFRRSTAADPPVAVEAYGSTIRDADGREYLDAAGGAIVVNVGHGRREIAAAMADQVGRLAGAAGITLLELTSQQASLEEAFIDLTRDAVEFRAPTTRGARP